MKNCMAALGAAFLLLASLKRFGLLGLAAVLSAPLLFSQVQISGPTVMIGGSGGVAGSAGQLQYNNGGAFAGATIITDGTNLNAPSGNIMGYTLGGVRYAVDAQTGGGANGIVNAAAANQVVVADPSYATTEQYSPTSIIPNWANFQLQDLRGGHNLFLSHNPPETYQPYGDTNNPGTLFYTQHDGAPAWPNDLYHIAYRMVLNDSTPGGNFDFPNLGAGSAAGWAEPQTLSVQSTVNSSGIDETLSIGSNKSGLGDHVGIYCNEFDYISGATGHSDEGKKCGALRTQAAAAEYSATCTSGCSTGTVHVLTACRSSTNACGPPVASGPGGYLLDSTQTPLSNTITGMVPSPLSTTSMSQLTMGSTVSVSNGWGTQQANIPTPNRMYCHYSTSALTAVLNASGGNTIYSGTITAGTSTGTTFGAASNGSTTLLVINPSGIVVGSILSGTGIASNTTVLAISGSTLTISPATTAPILGSAVAFASPNALAGCAVNVTGFGNSANNGPFTVVASTATTLTLNNGSGVAQSGSATSTVYPFAALMTFPITLVGGTGFDATHELCFATAYHECVVPTAAANAGGGIWNITAPLRHPHANGGYVFQGGLAGYAMEFPAYTATATGSSATFRYLFDILGCTGANTCQATWWFQGTPSVLTRLANLNVNNSLYGCANATNVSNSGTTVTATWSSYCGTNFGQLPDYTGATFYFTNGSNSTINGNCTNVTWTGANNVFTCTNATATGSNSAMTATFQLSKVGQNGLNVVNLYPAAEVLDVQGYTTNPPSIDGTLTLEPNPNLVVGPADVLEEQQVAADITNGATISNFTINPYMFEHGLSIGMSPTPTVSAEGSPQGGCLSVTCNSVLSMGTAPSSNNVPIYKGQGGWYIPPNLINETGAYFIGLDLSQGPALNQGIITMQHSAIQAADPIYCERIWDIYEAGNSPFYLQNCPNSKAVTLVTSGLYSINPASFLLSTAGAATYTAASHTFNGNVTLNGAANAISGANLSTTGGLLSGQGYNYAPFSNSLTSATWGLASGGTGTETCAITDDLGDPACTLTQTSAAAFNWHDFNLGGLTPLTLNASYVTQARMRGHVGAELVTLGGDNGGSNVHLTTSWANYCVVYTASASGSNLNHTAGINLNANGMAIDVANVVTAPGTSCSPAPLPLTTVNNQYTTLTNVNHAGNFDANSYTLAGAAINAAGGLAGLNSSGQLALAELGTGTPAAGKYVDGAAGAWTAVPTTPIRAGSWTISASTTMAVTFSTAMGSTPSSCSVTPSASSATTGQPFATSLATTGFTVNVPTSGTLSGTYLCALNNAF